MKKFSSDNTMKKLISLIDTKVKELKSYIDNGLAGKVDAPKGGNFDNLKIVHRQVYGRTKDGVEGNANTPVDDWYSEYYDGHAMNLGTLDIGDNFKFMSVSDGGKFQLISPGGIMYTFTVSGDESIDIAVNLYDEDLNEKETDRDKMKALKQKLRDRGDNSTFIGSFKIFMDGRMGWNSGARTTDDIGFKTRINPDTRHLEYCEWEHPTWYEFPGYTDDLKSQIESLTTQLSDLQTKYEELAAKINQ